MSSDGSTVFLSWYDPINQDMLLGMYGNVGKMEVANPSPVPTVVPGGIPSCSPTKPTSLDLTASGLTWDITCLAVTADTKFTVSVTNKDVPTPHDFSIYPDAGSGQSQSGALFSGFSKPDSSPTPFDYPVGPLKPGNYYFQCDFHPATMFGTFIVLGGKK